MPFNDTSALFRTSLARNETHSLGSQLCPPEGRDPGGAAVTPAGRPRRALRTDGPFGARSGVTAGGRGSPGPILAPARRRWSCTREPGNERVVAAAASLLLSVFIEAAGYCLTSPPTFQFV